MLLLKGLSVRLDHECMAVAMPRFSIDSLLMHTAIGCLRLLLGTILGQGLHWLAPAVKIIAAFTAEIGLLMLMVLLLLLLMCSGGHLLLMLLLLLLLLGRCERSHHVGRCSASDATTTASRGSLLGVVALLLGLVVV